MSRAGVAVKLAVMCRGHLTVLPLQSGSNGNCILVESAETSILIDAGLSWATTEQRLREHGRDPARIEAILVSHDHGDHVRHAGVLHRALGVPVHITEGSLQAARRRIALGELRDVQRIRPGGAFRVGALSVDAVATPHDGTEGVAFVVGHGGKRVGVLTDLGHVFGGLGEVIGECDAVVLESNYDPEMLQAGSYPAFLKRRIRGKGGHLSNLEAAELLGKHARPGLRWACLAHLSEKNNSPEVALATHRRVNGDAMALRVASRCGATAPLEV